MKRLNALLERRTLLPLQPASGIPTELGVNEPERRQGTSKERRRRCTVQQPVKGRAACGSCALHTEAVESVGGTRVAGCRGNVYQRNEEPHANARSNSSRRLQDGLDRLACWQATC